MSRIIFKLNSDNSVEILDTDFAEEYINTKTEGSSKIITISVVEQDMEILDREGYI